MTHTFEMDSPFGRVKASWQRMGKKIIVRYGSYEKVAQASDADATNLFVARDIVRGWIADDMKRDY